MSFKIECYCIVFESYRVFWGFLKIYIYIGDTVLKVCLGLHAVELFNPETKDKMHIHSMQAF